MEYESAEDVVAWGVLIGAVTFAQEQPKLVTYESKAKPAHKVVAELSSVVGEQLAVDGDASKHVLVISVKDVSADELLDRVAKICSSRWVDREGVKTLVPDQTARNQELMELRAKLLEQAESHIAAAEKALNGEKDENFMGFFGGGPTNLSQFVIDLGAKELAAALESRRRVYSTNPTQMQHRFRSRNANAMIDRIIKDHNTFVEESLPEIEEQLKQMERC